MFLSQPWTSDARMRWGLSGTISPHPSLSSNLTPNVFMPVFFCKFSRKYFLLADIISVRTCGGNKPRLWQTQSWPGLAVSSPKLEDQRRPVTSQGPGRRQAVWLATVCPLAGPFRLGNSIEIKKTAKYCYLGSLCAQYYLCNNLEASPH